MIRSTLLAVASVLLVTSCTSGGGAPNRVPPIEPDPMRTEFPLDNVPQGLETIGLQLRSSLTTNFDLCALNPEITLETRERVDTIRLGRYGEYEVGLCVVRRYGCRGGTLTLVDEQAALELC